METTKIEHGNIIRPLVYQKIVNPEHFMKCFNGFGISNYILKKLVHYEIKFIEIIFLKEIGKSTNYLISTKQYLQSELSFIFREGTKRDLQYFVNINDMIKI